ncbi:MAG: DUF1295 domain-containing protein [Pseudomonadota bacterium]
MALYVSLFITIAAFSTLWAMSLKRQDLGIIDIYWGPGFAVIGAVHLWLLESPTSGQIIFYLLTLTWALRLGGYLYIRHRLSHGEDRRYRAMRENGGQDFWWKSLFKICWLQAVIMWVVASPQHTGLSVSTAEPNAILFGMGIMIALVGLAIESIADMQLYRFKQNRSNPDAICVEGLWRYSRHPNYFGEILVWIGFGLCGFALSGSYWAFLGPALIIFLLIKVSGVALLDRHLSAAKPDYAAYASRTSALIPWPPRTESG